MMPAADRGEAQPVACRENEQRGKPVSKELAQKKKSRARCPALKIVSTLFPRKAGFDLDLAGRRCLCAPGLLPRLGPPDFNLAIQPERKLVAHLSAVVIILSNDCSNLEQFLK
jgi:hypothetical protein